MQIRCLVNRLLKRGKVQKVAILGLDGAVQMRSDDLDLSEGDVRAILSTLRSGDNGRGMISLMRIPLLQTTFTCMFQAACDDAPAPLVGRADNLMFAALKTSKCVVVGLSDLESPGSCIYEISEMGRVIELRSH